jgi:hypothetical protein
MVCIKSWTNHDLDRCILALCVEFPDARMSACSRAVEHCRQNTPPGTLESLLEAMRAELHADPQSRRHTEDPSRRTLEAHDPVTRDQVCARTRELARRAGRVPPDVTQIDFEQAKRDVTGENDRALQELALYYGNKGVFAEMRLWTEQWKR